MDKYALISFAPSIAIVAAMIVGTGFAIKWLKGEIAKDAAAADQAK
ncbi:hypothetical protein QKW35_17705 [Pontibacterium granulatum]|nr:hypothetical protein [Pontibacterium granulatum]MDI3326214.1 hypothetical protein [Pontibacterium granulatum]